MKTIFLIPDNTPWSRVEEAAHILGMRSYSSIDGVLTFLPHVPVIEPSGGEHVIDSTDVRGVATH